MGLNSNKMLNILTESPKQILSGFDNNILARNEGMIKDKYSTKKSTQPKYDSNV